MGQMATLSTRLRYLVADKFDSAITGAYGLAAGSENRIFANSAYNMRQYDRYKGIVDIAQQVDDLPHDLRIAKIAEEYDQHGVGASLSYFASNPTIASSLIAQSLPSIFTGAGVGKVGTGLLATGLEKTALNAGVKNYLLKASTMGTIGAVSTAGMGYQQNVVHAYQKTGDYQKTIAEADKRTAVDSTFGFAGGLMPYFSKGSTWAGRALNVFTEATTQGLAGSTGAYYSAKSVGEEATGGELFLNFIMGYLTTPADIIAAKFAGGKKFDEPARADLQTANDVIVEIKNMALTQRDPETARQIIKNIKEQADSGLQDVYIPAEEFNRYFQEQGIDPIELADRVTGKQGALEEALATGADLQIPLENYAIDIVAKGHDTAFNETLRTAPDTMNARELTEFDSQLKESTEELAKQIDESINKESAYLTDRAIYDNVFQQLKEAGIDKASAERQALLYQALFNTLGQRLGVDPMSIFSKYNLQIGRDLTTGADSLRRFNQEDTKLSAIHNLTADNLIFADDLGGLAVPSIGVITKNKGGIDGFGDITLIGTKNLADPKQVPAFSSDAYSARFPREEFKPIKNYKEIESIIEPIEIEANRIGDSIVIHTMRQYLEQGDLRGNTYRWENSPAIKSLFLKERGVEIKPVLKEPSFDTGLNKAELKKVEKLYNQLLAIAKENGFNEKAEQFVNEQIKPIMEASLERRYSDRQRLLNDLKNSLKEQDAYSLYHKLRDDINKYQKLAGKKEVDEVATAQKIDKKFTNDKIKAEFKKWVSDQLRAI